MRANKTVSNEAMEPHPSDGALTAALQQQPAMAVPADFAARLMSRLPDEKPGRAAGEHAVLSVGRRVGYASAAATTLALLALAGLNPGALEAGRTVAFGVEMLLVAELLGIGLWLGIRRDA